MPDDTWDMERCVIVGAAGCGKTTLGKRLADHFESPFYDIDALFWKPGWVESQTDELRALTSAATAGKRWVIAGNYTSQLRDIVWSRADTLIWLDLPRSTTFPRVVRRTVLDAMTRRELWPGCRQTILIPFRTHLFGIAWAQSENYKEIYEGFLREIDMAHLEVIRLTHKREVDRWLEDLHRSCF